ncbi:Uncharacterised protein [Legionella wadsworthii]|uniref:Uncharacterized protein n=1 Tax=Legionella wadsworthii TaxID=28088 RepID=A0A378LRQ4_9GAMM|nr:hypothetical protein [Legionella wadsworthii]STY29050.1 Uncharacterised protein [Legionella wadsworthii]
MTKFFDSKTKTLFITQGRTAAADLSDNPLIQLPEQGDMPPSPQLRRQLAQSGSHCYRHYISTTGEELEGNFDLKDHSNSDLQEVGDTIYCP